MVGNLRAPGRLRKAARSPPQKSSASSASSAFSGFGFRPCKSVLLSVLISGRVFGRVVPRPHVLIQPEKILRIVMRLDRHHAIPSFVICLGGAILLVSACESCVSARRHGRP